MNEDNKIFKTNEISIEISPVKNTVDSQRAQYYSYDENSGLQRIHILKDGQPLGLPEGSEIRLSAVKLSGTKQMMVYTPEIEDRVNGIVTFVIPKEFLGYSGQIRCTLYIDFSSDQTLHAGYFYINMGISDIDANLPEFSDSYWQRWTDFESEATTKMKELEQRIDEQTEIFNKADVYNKAEIEDKLEPFALRTDIDTLEINKADKTALSESNQKIDSLVSNKVDKGGASQVTWGMLAQDAREQISGGKIAIVGENSVSSENIVDESVNRVKLDPNLSGFNNNRTELIYDSAQRVIFATEKNGDLVISRTELAYGTDGKLESVIETANGKKIVTNLIYFSDGRISYAQNTLEV